MSDEKFFIVRPEDAEDLDPEREDYWTGQIGRDTNEKPLSRSDLTPSELERLEELEAEEGLDE